MGRAALIMVMGFSTALLMIGSNVSKISNQAMDNYIHYYNSSMAHNIATTGTNLAARALWENFAWQAGFANKKFAGGTFTSTVTTTPTSNQTRLTTTATFQGETATISVLLQPSSFSRFGYYSNVEGNIWWITGDTVWGPMHTQDNLRVSGQPAFMQRTTSLKSIIYQNGPPPRDNPQFLGGYETGVNVSLPSNLTPLLTAANNGGRVFNGPDSVYIEFQSNGNVKWKQGAGSAWNVDPLTTFAPNGVIYANGTDVRVSGTLNGRVTLGAGGPTGNKKQGNIFIDNDIYYAHDPAAGSSTDLLGLVAENNILVSDNTANSGNDITIQASCFSRSGSFTVENYASRGVEGTIRLLGGIQQDERGPVGTFDTDRHGNPYLKNGYLKNYLYDNRLMYDAPPFFPTTGNYEIVSWFE
jgi:hypothetical protein